MVHQGYIEPHNAVGIYNSDGHAHDLLLDPGHLSKCARLTARCSRMPEGNIKVVPAEIGGGFGGKLDGLPRTAGATAVQEDRQAGQAGDDARRSAARDRADLGLARSAARWVRPKTASSSRPKSGWLTKRAGFPVRRSAPAR